MRLKHVWIKEYKNLRNFEIDFDEGTPVNVLVGLNGSGKSNLFEALLHIFSYLYDSEEGISQFDFILIYEKDGIEHIIEYTDYAQIEIDGVNVGEVDRNILPDQVVIAYSGHNKTIKRISENFKFYANLQVVDEEIETTTNILYLNYEDIDIFYSIFAPTLQDDNIKEINIDKTSIPKVLKIKYERPHLFSFDESHNIDDVDNDRYWKPSEGVLEILDTLDSQCTYTFRDEIVREVGYQAPKNTELQYGDYYIHYYDIEKIITAFQDRLTVFQLAYFFIDLRQAGMLTEIEPLDDNALNNANPSLVRATLSDGQLQRTFLESILIDYYNKESLLLFDEPDAFLHPEWQRELLSSLTKNSISVKHHAILSTHNPVTLIAYEGSNIPYLSIADKKVVAKYLKKRDAVFAMSSDLISYSGDMQLLDVLSGDFMPVFFTEGFSDIYIIKNAWEKLFSAERFPVYLHPVFGFKAMASLLTRQDVRKILDKRPIFGLFDFDEAYNDWNGVNGVDVSISLSSGLIRQYVEKKSEVQHSSFALLMPVPDIPEILRQVFKNGQSGEHYKHHSCCTIEHVFYRYLNTQDYFESESRPGGASILKFRDSKKIHFAETIVPTLPPAAFEPFRPMFEFIKSKCAEFTAG